MSYSALKLCLVSILMACLFYCTSCKKDTGVSNDEIYSLLKEMKKNDSLLLVSYNALHKQVDSLLKITGSNSVQLNNLKITLDSVLVRLTVIQNQLNSQSANIISIQSQLNQLLLLYQSLLQQFLNFTTRPSLADSVKVGLIAYYPFDNNLFDSTANPANGQGFGTWSFIANRANQSSKAISISSGYIELANSSKLHFVKDNTFSVTGWININSLTNSGRILSSENSEGNLRFSVWSSGSKKRIDFGFGNSIVSVDNIDTDTWYHFCYSYSITGSKIYINGNLVNQNSIANNEVRAFAGFRFGQKNAPAFDQFYGRIDEMRFYSRQLSASEIAYLFNN